ncbi:hypothetical protein [Chitinophaga agri]|uniref:Uncharacterized protein n=1 Tax=Chitinophaga agri TaxID=2703787 RepID=A0A6B9Z7N7_9BACT|nr:hypothetical protein [Chitinophaga agri]QHS58252.1 hypothetical protein GWR21_01170 [Chitinophaga agri]
MSSFHKQLILNEDTAFYQLVLCAVFVAVVPPQHLTGGERLCEWRGAVFYSRYLAGAFCTFQEEEALV